MSGDLGLFEGDRSLANDLADYERRRLEQVWRDGRSRHRDQCRSCRRPITWLVTEAGKWMPVDPRPDPAGNLAVEQRGCARVANHAARIGAYGRLPPERYMPHWHTCNDPERWRKARPRMGS